MCNSKAMQMNMYMMDDMMMAMCRMLMCMKTS